MAIMREKNPQTPGVYIEEVPSGARPIQAVGTRTAGFVGVAPDPAAHLNQAMAINNWTEFRTQFFPEENPDQHWTNLAYGVYGFFLNGGSRCFVVNVGVKTNGDPNPVSGGGGAESGLDVLARVDEVAIVAAPGYTDTAAYNALLNHCAILHDRVAILDGPAELTKDTLNQLGGEEADESGADDSNGAWVKPGKSESGETTLYVPWIKVSNPNRVEVEKKIYTVTIPPSGHIAGVWARSDALRGVHKAPANEIVHGALDLQYRISYAEQGPMNFNGVNCIRYFSNEGFLVWGARTYCKNDNWRYLNVRRLFNMIEESIVESTRWIVFEPNDRSLWNAIRRDVSAFLMGFWRDGALMGRTPEEAFYVKCDEENNPIESINQGRVVIEIGIAPVKPAEFVMFKISQYEAGTEVEVGG
jgi:Bacteriophage tail sheath protein